MTPTFDPFDPDQWSGAPGCQAFELALEMRARSALAASAVPVLEAHLAACDSCRDHAASMAGFDAALAAHGGGEPAAPTWARVDDRLAASVRRYRRRTPWVIGLAGAGALAASAILGALLDPGPMRIAAMAGGSALYLAVMAVVYRVHLRRQQRLLAQTDVVATYRGELVRRLRIARGTRWAWLLLVALKLPNGYHELMRTLAGNAHAPARLATNALLIGCGIAAFVMTFFAARTARRELAGLR